ncbi:hypothetical protein ABE768_000881 [Escherichia coli]
MLKKYSLKAMLLFTIIHFPTYGMVTGSQYIYVGDDIVTVKVYTSSVEQKIVNSMVGHNVPFSAAITIDRPLKTGIGAPSNCSLRYDTPPNFNIGLRYAYLRITTVDKSTSEWSLYPGGGTSTTHGSLTNVIANTVWQPGVGEVGELTVMSNMLVAEAVYVCRGGPNYNFEAPKGTVHLFRDTGNYTGDRISESAYMFSLSSSKQAGNYISLFLSSSKITELNKPVNLVTSIQSSNRYAYTLTLSTTSEGMDVLKLTNGQGNQINWGAAISDDVYVQAVKNKSNASYPVQLYITYY